MQTSLYLNITSRRVRQNLNASTNFEHRKRKIAPALTKYQKQKREEWVKEKVKWNDKNWSNVIFSDEKKFNLDGPDGSQYYWHDSRKEDQIFSKRPFGCGSLMVWGAFSIIGKASLLKMKGRQNAQKYTAVLQTSLVLFLTEYHSQHEIF